MNIQLKTIHNRMHFPPTSIMAVEISFLVPYLKIREYVFFNIINRRHNNFYKDITDNLRKCFRF